MALNLSKVERKPGSLPRHTFRRETTMPRQSVDLPDAEVNAQIRRPNVDDGETLARILGLTNSIGQKALRGIQDKRNAQDDADASFDLSTGRKDDERYAKSFAYREAYQREGAKNVVTTVSQSAKEAAEAVLNDPSATLEDVNEAIEAVFSQHIMDERGELLDFGTPEAKTILANGLDEVKKTLMPQAVEAIREHENTRMASTIFRNLLVEKDRGAPIGAPVEVTTTDPDDGPDPLAPLPERKGHTVLLGAPTGRRPHPGAITSTMDQHAKRGSVGVDIDGRIGDPIEAPAGGKVTVGRDKRSGLFVQIDHGGGVVSTYSHLSHTDLKNGDVVRPGQKFAAMGNTGNVSKRTGDGSHLHWRVKVNGKDVNPLAYSFPSGAETVVVETGAEPKLTKEVPEAIAERAGFPIEEFMGRLPPSMNKKWAKTWLINTLFASAADTGDASLLNGLEDATRADGTPSLSPEETLKVVQTRDALRERARVRTEQAERRMQQQNADLVVQALLEGNEPDPSWLAAQARDGFLDEGFALTIQNQMEAAEERRLRQADMAARQAQAAADDAIDIEVLEMAVERRAGSLRGSSYEEDLRRLRNGELGDGIDAVKRFDQLQAAARAGRERANDTPEVRVFAKKLEQFKPISAGNGDFLRASRVGTALSSDQYAGLMAHFEQLVAQGKAPEDAYDSAVKRYVPSGNRRQSLMQRKADLLRKQRTGS